MKELTLITENAAIPIEDVVVVTKVSSKQFNEYNQLLDVFNINIILDRQYATVNIGCKNKEEMEQTFERILILQGEARNAKK